MTGLIKNELIKTGKSGFIRAALCFILILCVLIPVGCKILNSEVVANETDFDALVERENTTAGKTFYQVSKESEEFFEKNKIADYNDWRYNEYSYYLQSLMMSKSVLELKKQGCERTDIENYFAYENLNAEITFDNKTGEVSASEDNYKSVFDLTDEETDKKLAELEKMIEDCKKFILDASISDFYKNSVDTYTSRVEMAKADVKKAERELAESPENEQKEYNLNYAKAILDGADMSLWGAEYLYNNSVKYNSWKYNTVINVINYVANTYADFVPITRTEFRTSYERQTFKEYDEYVAIAEKNKENADNALALAKYSIENNIPLPEELDDSVRFNFIDDVATVLYLVGILMVAIAGTTMFNEYSTGSIRLLLIRPKSRNKILMSKLMSVVIYGLGTAAAVILLLAVLDNLLHNGKDFTVPYLLMKGGRVVEIPTILFVIAKTMAKLFSGFVIVACAFMISTLFSKGGIFAVAAGSGAMCLTYLAEMLCANFNAAFNGLLTYTVLPYLDLSQYMGNSVADFSFNNFSMLNEVAGGISAQVQFNPQLGAVIDAIHIALFLVIAFIGFKKKQIKN
ncbi:MAG: ABC transporter permease subunit [Clostridia bacterium]|nr:ABC transporter permease subunit [Clostridia bacterium]